MRISTRMSGASYLCVVCVAWCVAACGADFLQCKMAMELTFEKLCQIKRLYFSGRDFQGTFSQGLLSASNALNAQ